MIIEELSKNKKVSIYLFKEEIEELYHLVTSQNLDHVRLDQKYEQIMYETKVQEMVAPAGSPWTPHGPIYRLSAADDRA